MKRVLILFLVSLCIAVPVLADAWETPEGNAAGYLALTFDDGPSGPITERLLDGLLARNAKATFFLCGYRMADYPGPIPRYLAEGHELGVHSTRHLTLTEYTPAEIRKDLLDTCREIEEMTGARPALMRPPGGAYNKNVLAQAEDLGLGVILWSVDPRDWSSSAPDAIVRSLEQQAEDGDIILMHDMSRASVDAALRFVDHMEARGFRFVTVSQLAALRQETVTPGRVYRAFR